MLERDSDRLLTTAQVAELFGVGTKTINRWAKENVFPADAIVRAHPRAQRRYREVLVRELLARGDN